MMKIKTAFIATLFLATCATANAQQKNSQTQTQASQENTRETSQVSLTPSPTLSSRDTIACLADNMDTEMCAQSATTNNKKVSPGLYAAHAGFKKVYKRSVAFTGGLKYIVLEVGN